MSEFIHIVSCVVRLLPAAQKNVAEAIRSANLGEVFEQPDPSCLVIVIDADSDAGILDRIDVIRALTGVIAVNMIYQHVESANDLAKEFLV